MQRVSSFPGLASQLLEGNLLSSATSNTSTTTTSTSSSPHSSAKTAVSEEMTLDQIFNGTGKEQYYPGLIPLVYAYLDYINCDEETLGRVSKYLEFIKKRAKGELLTPATWMRKFVTQHADYKGDSVISEEIAYDLMMTCKGIGEGTISCPELLGDVRIDRYSIY